MIDELPLPRWPRLRRLNAQGGFAAAESWAWHREPPGDARQADYDPRVALRIRRGAGDERGRLHRPAAARAALDRRMQAALARLRRAARPPCRSSRRRIAPLLADDEAFFATNALLLRNPSVVNLLDGCALSLPCQAPDELPVGLMVWGRRMADDRVLSTCRWRSSARLGRGARALSCASP